MLVTYFILSLKTYKSLNQLTGNDLRLIFDLF